MDSTKALHILLRTGRNLKQQGLPRERRRTLLAGVLLTLKAYPINRRRATKGGQGLLL